MDELFHPAPLYPSKKPRVSRTSIVSDVIAQELAVERTVPGILLVYVCTKSAARPSEGEECWNVEILGDVVERLLRKGEQPGLLEVIVMTDGCMLGTFLTRRACVIAMISDNRRRSLRANLHISHLRERLKLAVDSRRGLR